MYDLVIIGSGAAGLSAGLYAGRYRLNTLIVGKERGGETARAGEIANYPGVKPIDGYDLMKIIAEQAESFGTKIMDKEVTAIKKEGHCFTIEMGEEKVTAKTILFAGGAEYRKLNIPNEKELTSRGVHYCVTCDGPVYTDKVIAIVGGGDSAVKAAILASEYVKKIYIINREMKMGGEPVNYENMEKIGNKIEILNETEVAEIIGTEKLEKIILSKEYKGTTELVIDGLFVEIGFIPNVELMTSIGVELDEKGYIKADNMMKTNIDGVFVAGDTMNHFGAFKQDITAAASGALAATSAYEDTKVHGDLCQIHHQPARRV